MKQSGNILFSGVGGQGILLASELTAYAQLEAGFDVKKSEVHGMAQQGILNLFYKKALATDPAEGAVQDPVSLCLYPDQLDLEFRISGLDLFFYPFTLGQRQLAPSCTDL